MALDEIITLAYGSGGKKTSELIDTIIVPAFNNNELAQLSDGAVLSMNQKLVFSTDSYVISPYFFPGGDIGKLSVCGTINDLCMCGGMPKYLSLGFIIEEGFQTQELIKIVESISATAAECGVKIVTGDTKVVERGKGDGIYINTSGIGNLVHEGLSLDKVQEGDCIIVTGTVGDHGMAIMASRNNLITESTLKSDCTPLVRLAEVFFEYGSELKIMRDPTRGGLATTLNEFVENRGFGIELEEDLIPINEAVANVSELLGLDPLYSANEGKIVAIVKPEKAEEIIKALRKHEEGKDATIIGRVSLKYPSKVVLKTYLGGTRILSKLTGAQLPRIC